MKNKITILLILLSFNAFSQIKVASNGNVSLGHTNNPIYSLDIYGSTFRTMREGSSNFPLRLNHYGSDPRLGSDRKIVFYNEGIGYIRPSMQDLD